MPETILVVDDDPDIARFVEVNLRSAGYDVAVASDGEEALQRANEMRPDLVLLDVMMPRIDGFEVAQRLRRNPVTANTSIIMLTAKALSTDKVLGLTAGADDYIIKPFDPIELLARVKGTLRRAKEMRNLSPMSPSSTPVLASGWSATATPSPCCIATSTTSRHTTTRRDSSGVTA